MSKYHIVGNHMSWLTYVLFIIYRFMCSLPKHLLHVSPWVQVIVQVHPVTLSAVVFKVMILLLLLIHCLMSL